MNSWLPRLPADSLGFQQAREYGCGVDSLGGPGVQHVADDFGVVAAGSAVLGLDGAPRFRVHLGPQVAKRLGHSGGLDVAGRPESQSDVDTVRRKQLKGSQPGGWDAFNPPLAYGRGLNLKQLGDPAGAAEGVNEGVRAWLHVCDYRQTESTAQGLPIAGVSRLTYMSTWGDRIRQARERSGISQSELARRVGVKPPSVHDWESGKTKSIEGKNLLAAARALGVTPEWISTGREITPDALPARYAVVEADPGQALEIEFMDVLGSCGGGVLNLVAERRSPLMKEPQWFKRYGLRPDDALAVWADGDSMADYIVDGDIVIFDRSKRTPRSGKIFLLEHPDGLRIKRLRQQFDRSWILESNNPDKRRYPDEAVTAEQAEHLRVIGQFVYRQGG